MGQEYNWVYKKKIVNITSVTFEKVKLMLHVSKYSLKVKNRTMGP